MTQTAMIYYIAPDSTVMAVPVAMKNGDPVAGAAQPLFRPRIVGGGVNRVGQRHEYDVAPDGRFLVNVEAGSATSSSITLLLNWKPEQITHVTSALPGGTSQRRH